MSSHHLVDKGLHLEALASGWAAAKPFPEPGAPLRYAPDRPVRVLQLDIGLRIDPASPEVHGDTTLELEAVGAELGEVVLDLSEDHEVRAVTDGAGQALEHRHRGDQLLVRGLRGRRPTVRVQSVAQPRRGLYRTGPTVAEPDRPAMAWSQCQDEDGHFLFPCFDHPGLKQPTRARITAPDGLEVVGNGALVSKQAAAPGWTTWTWDERRPLPAYLFTVVVGPMVVVDGGVAGQGKVPLRFLAPAGADPAVLSRVFARTGAMIEAFEERFGVPYPWPRYDQVIVHDFIFGGMENAGATTLTDLCLTDAAAALVHDPDDLIAHELAHQWFGDLLTCREWSQGWLNEGFATWSESIWRRARDGEEEALLSLLDMLDEYLDEAESRYQRSIIHRGYRAPIDLFDRHLYEKGALVLQTLCHTLGADTFWAGVTRYLTAHAGGVVHTRDLQVALEEVSGRDLSRFFEAFVLGAGHPVVKVSTRFADGVLTVQADQSQGGEGVAARFPIALDVLVIVGAEQHRLTLPLGEGPASRTLSLSGPPDRVEVDPQLTVLAALELEFEPALLAEGLRVGSTVITRIRCARALAPKATAKGRAALHQAAASDPSWAVRAEALRLLSKVGGAEARATLLQALHDADARVRSAAVDGLGKQPSHADILDALQAAGADPSLHVAAGALRALGQLRGPGVVATLSAALDRSSWGDLIRVRAAEGLGACRDPEALPLLLRLTGPAHTARAQAAAAAGLGKLAHELPTLKPRAAERLEELARHGSFRVRLAAIGALGTLAVPSTLGTLREIHAEDLDGRTRRSAWEALERARTSGGPQGPLADLRQELDAVRQDNRKLRDRVEALERAPTG
ncbi:MAG: HEAT repeat domain-containing protein [Deltaproteobacteria bacterium]|nr:HEAT repeat domain-containing protein [Deltaproteobacteria bacterium]